MMLNTVRTWNFFRSVHECSTPLPYLFSSFGGSESVNAFIADAMNVLPLGFSCAVLDLNAQDGSDYHDPDSLQRPSCGVLVMFALIAQTACSALDTPTTPRTSPSSVMDGLCSYMS